MSAETEGVTAEGTPRQTRFRIAGEGPPVMLIHGVGLDLAMWDGIAARLPGRRVLRYDMLGHGGSARPPGPYVLDAFVAQLVGLVDELGLDAFDLAGFSMGGLVAQAMALRHPARLRRLVLLNTVYDRSPAESEAVRARAAEVLTGGYSASIDAAIERWFTPGFRAAHPQAVAAVRRRMEANDLKAYAAAYTLFATGDRELVDHVAGIAAPTLVATGADDQRSTPAMTLALASRLPNGRSRILPGLRHLALIEAPDEVAALIDGFLALSC